MGLFDGKAKQESAESEVLQKLSAVPLLDLLIENVLNEAAADESWLQIAQNYYDSCKRTVTVEADGFEIKWSGYHDEQYVGNDGNVRTKRVEDIYGRIGYSYTKSGYRPLHGYTYEGGKKTITTDRVCWLWASVIRERMAAKMPSCDFDGVCGTKGGATFTYTVPKLSFKDWF